MLVIAVCMLTGDEDCTDISEFVEATPNSLRTFHVKLRGVVRLILNPELSFLLIRLGRGRTPVIQPNPTRKHVSPFDNPRYRDRNIIERPFSHIKEWHRVATH